MFSFNRFVVVALVISSAAVGGCGYKVVHARKDADVDFVGTVTGPKGSVVTYTVRLEDTVVGYGTLTIGGTASPSLLPEIVPPGAVSESLKVCTTVENVDARDVKSRLRLTFSTTSPGPIKITGLVVTMTTNGGEVWRSNSVNDVTLDTSTREVKQTISLDKEKDGR